MNDTNAPKKPNPVARNRTVTNVINNTYTRNNLFSLGVISIFEVRVE